MLLWSYVWTIALAVVATKSNSPWASASWRINLEFHRDYDERTSSSSSKTTTTALVLPVRVLIESKPQDTLDDFMLSGSGKSDLLSVLENVTYITMKGQQDVSFGTDGGGWRIFSRRTPTKGDAGQVRLWMDLQTPLQKNDKDDFYVKPQRLYLMAKCWRQDEYDVGVQRFRPLRQAYDDIQTQIDDRLVHETGDRRLDGTDLVETTMGSIDMTLLLAQRQQALNRLRDASQFLPTTTTGSSAATVVGNDEGQGGPWPGSTEPLVIAQGQMEIKDSSSSSSLLTTEYRKIGTWTATPLLLDDDDEYGDEEDEYEYEEYEEDDENEDDDDGEELQGASS